MPRDGADRLRDQRERQAERRASGALSNASTLMVNSDSVSLAKKRGSLGLATLAGASALLQSYIRR